MKMTKMTKRQSHINVCAWKAHVKYKCPQNHYMHTLCCMLVRMSSGRYLRFTPLHILLLDICSNCGHVVAVHNYTFSVADGYQVCKYVCMYVCTCYDIDNHWNYIAPKYYIGTFALQYPYRLFYKIGTACRKMVY